MLHVDDSRQLLDSVEQQVALLDGFLVLPVFTVGSATITRWLEFCLFPSQPSSTGKELPVGFHYFVHFVNFTVEAAGSYESRQFSVEREH